MGVTEEVFHSGDFFLSLTLKEREASTTWWIVYSITDLSLHDEGMHSTVSVQIYMHCSIIHFNVQYMFGNKQFSQKNFGSTWKVLFLSPYYTQYKSSAIISQYLK